MRQSPVSGSVCVLLSFVVLLAGACTDDKAGSFLNSLEALRGEDITRTCEGADAKSARHADGSALALRVLVADEISGPRRTALRSAAERTLSAVPGSMLLAFTRLGGDVRITPDAGRICAAVYRERQTTESASDLANTALPESCWVALHGNGRQKNLSIVIDASEKVIGSGLVRAFGYAMAQYIASLDVTDGRVVRRDSPDPDVEADAETLAKAFFLDIGRDRSLDAVSSASPGDPARRRFATFVMAEAFDSWHCSAQSRSAMVARFPAVHAAYGPVLKRIAGRAARILHAASARRAGAGFGLQEPAATTATSTTDDTVTVNVATDGSIDVEKPDDITVIVNTPPGGLLAETGGLSTAGDTALPTLPTLPDLSSSLGSETVTTTDTATPPDMATTTAGATNGEAHTDDSTMDHGETMFDQELSGWQGHATYPWPDQAADFSGADQGWDPAGYPAEMGGFGSCG